MSQLYDLKVLIENKIKADGLDAMDVMGKVGLGVSNPAPASSEQQGTEGLFICGAWARVWRGFH